MVTNMIYDHLVKHNGKYYNPGEEVPETTESLNLVPEEISDKDIVFETNSVAEIKSSGRRGRPKKSEQ